MPRLAKAVVAVVAGASVAAAGGMAAGAEPSAPSSASAGVSVNPHVDHHPVRVHPADTQPAFGIQRRATAAAGNSVVGGPWTSLGPAPIADEKSCCNPSSDYGRASGRMTSVAVDPTNAAVIFAGTAGGGVWKSSNAGTTWTALTDSQATLAIGALAIDPSGQVLYAGTGEANGSVDSQAGQGILKTTDGGASWSLLGQTIFAGQHIGGLAIDRNTSGASQRVYAAADEGLYASVVGGATWTRNSQIASQLTPAVVNGVTQQPSGDMTQVIQDSSGSFWAVASDFCRTEYGDILTSADGNTWVNHYAAAHPPAATRIGLGVGTGGVAYASIAGCPSGSLAGLQKTVDGGATWTAMSTSALGFTDPFTIAGASQGWYDNAVAVDPSNAGTMVVGGITAMLTKDAGASYTDVIRPYSGGVVHPDFHALLFSSGALLVANDGGLWKTTDLGTSWTNLNGNLNTIQFFGGAALDLQHLLGGSQDNGSPGVLPGSRASAPAWQHYLDGDGGYPAIDPSPGSTTIYATTNSGGIYKGSSAPPPSPDASWPYDTFQEADPCPAAGGQPACSDPVAFIAPFVMDPGNPARLLAATNRVYQSTSGGLPAGAGGWARISPNLATATPTPGRTDVIERVVMGPAGATGTVLTGSHFGALWRSTNATGPSAAWTDVTGNLPPFDLSKHVTGAPWIPGIAFTPSNTAEAWVTIGGLGVGHVWHTLTAGAATGTVWVDLSGVGPIGFPDQGTNDMLVDPTRGNALYVAGDSGVMVCYTCAGVAAVPNWQILGSGLPHVRVNG